MARVVVDVMLKPEILDPQGQAVQRALPRLGFEGISDVRQGKRFELEVEGPVDDAALARIHELAETFLANTVIEDFAVKVEEVAESEVTARIGVVTFPGTLDDRDTQRAVRARRRRAGAALAPRQGPQAGRRGRAARRLLLRRLSARRRHLPLLAGDGDRHRAGARPACRCSASATASRCSRVAPAAGRDARATTTCTSSAATRSCGSRTRDTAWTADYAAGQEIPSR